MNKWCNLLALCVSLVLVACATTHNYWQHNQLTGQPAQQQLTADRGTCTIAAYQAIGGPPTQPQRPPDTQTTFSGTTSRGDYFSGQARANTSDPNPSASALQQGRIESEYKAALTNVFNGCMAQRGWSLRAVTR